MRKMVDLQLMRHRVLLEACALCALCLLVAAWRVPCSVTTKYLPLKARNRANAEIFSTQLTLARFREARFLDGLKEHLPPPPLVAACRAVCLFQARYHVAMFAWSCDRNFAPTPAFPTFCAGRQTSKPVAPAEELFSARHEVPPVVRNPIAGLVQSRPYPGTGEDSMKTVAADMLLILSNRGGCAIELCWWARALIIVDLFGVVRSYRQWEHGYGVEKHDCMYRPSNFGDCVSTILFHTF